MKLKEKFKTYSFWTGLSAAIIMLINALGQCFKFSVDNSLVNNIIMSICGVLVVFGVVTPPPTKQNDKIQNETDVQENIEETKISDEINIEIAETKDENIEK